MKKYSLAIVQTHATQFDGPLFRLMAAHPDIDLMVYYTNRQANILYYDPELNRQSGWDHDITTGYTACLFPDSILKRWALANSIVKRGRYDLVIVSGYNTLLTLAIAMLGKFHQTAVGLRGDSVFTHQKNNWKWRLKNILLPLIFRIYATGHPTGSLTRNVMKHYGMSDRALFYFPYAVDNEYLKAEADKCAPKKISKRETMGIGPDDFVILGVLKFVPREDPLTLLAAYSFLIKQYPETHLIIVGDGSLMTDIISLVSEQRLTQVHLPGYLPYSELPCYYALGDVFVHPAKVEPWGVSVNEAMACGLPVIAADTVGAGFDLIEDGKTGFVYTAGQPESLAEQLEKLIKDPTMTRSMGLRANECVLKWSYTKTVEQSLQALEFVNRRKKAHE